MSHISHNDSWKTPTDSQKLSHRTILRFQQLANDLRDDINKLPLFCRKGRRINRVLFVSRDADYSKEQCARFYNYRLCESYRFPSQVFTWLQSNDANDVPNVRRFEPLFIAATHLGLKTSFQHFTDAIQTHNDQRAHELVIDAVSVIPYRGVLLSQFESAYGDRRGKSIVSNNVSCCWFWGSEQCFNLQRFNGFYPGKQLIKEQEQGEMVFHPEIEKVLNKAQQTALRNLFVRFINPFTLGSDPNRSNDGWPYTLGADRFSGFVVPAYDAWDSHKGWQGGMAGWVVLTVEGKARRRRTSERAKRAVKSNWTSFTQVLRPFVRRVREAQLRELLESYAAHFSAITVDDYLCAHIHHLTGWTYNSQSQLRIILFRKDNSTLDGLAVKPQPDTKPRGLTEVPFPVIWLCQQLLDGLYLIYERLEALRQRDILLGQTRVSHGITRTVDQALNSTALVAQAISELKTSSSFPLHSFSDLPAAIRDFRFPVGLYSVAVENACKDGLDENNFRRWLPCIEWIDDALQSRGLDAQLLTDVSNNIAKPLAKNSRRHFYSDAGKIDNCVFDVSGEIPVFALDNMGLPERRVLLALIVELLGEAFQHCDESQPCVSVTFAVTPLVSVTVTNTTPRSEIEARLLTFKSGNQQRTREVLLSRLHGWQLDDPETEITSTIARWRRRLHRNAS